MKHTVELHVKEKELMILKKKHDSKTMLKKIFLTIKRNDLQSVPHTFFSFKIQSKEHTMIYI